MKQAAAIKKAPGLGHNKPPSEAEALSVRLAERANRDFGSRVNDTLAAAKRIGKINDDAAAGDAGIVIRLARALENDLDRARVAEKEPFLAAGRTVDSFFKKTISPIAGAKDAVQSKLDAYIVAKEEREREAAEAAAEVARKEADRLAREAKKKRASEETLTQAVEARVEAEHLAEAAEASSADLVRVRGDEGTVTIRSEWRGELVDRESLDLESLRAHFSEDSLEKAIRAFVRAGGRALKGASIAEHKSSMVL